MDNLPNDKVIDKKELLREKRELKKLERFMYDRELTLRDSTRKIIKQDNYYAEGTKAMTIEAEGNTSKKARKVANKSNEHKKVIIKNVLNKQISDLDDIEGTSINPSVTNIDIKNDVISIVSNSEAPNKISMSFSRSFLQDSNIIVPAAEDIKYDTSIQEKVEKEYPHEIKKYYLQKDNFNENNLGSKTFINCDLRFFNFDLITSRIGYLDVIMLDPPWRIKGGQRNDSSFMFSNSKFNLEYNTLSNNEIISLPVEKLSKKGK
jgi:hypothetical protein